MEDRSTSSPVWRLIGEITPTGSAERITSVVRVTHDGWRDELTSALSRSDPGDLILVVVDRGLAKMALAFLSLGTWHRPTTPTITEVVGFLRSRGVQLQQRYVLWPSSDQVRIAFPETSRAALTWVQRSGVLGGGGRRLWARALARSFLFTPLARILTPSFALTGRIEHDVGRGRSHAVEGHGEDDS